MDKLFSDANMDKWFSDAKKRSVCDNGFYNYLLCAYKVIVMMEKEYNDESLSFTKYVIRDIADNYLYNEFPEEDD